MSGRPPPDWAARARPTARATAAMSMTFSSGFVGVSNQTRRVASVSASQSTSGSRGEVHVPGVDPASRPVHPLEVAVRPAVDVVADDDLLARARQLRDGRRRRRPARERDPVRPRPRASATARSRRSARGVLGAAVLVAAARAARRRPGRTCCLVDRRRDGPGQLVRLGAGVDARACRRRRAAAPCSRHRTRYPRAVGWWARYSRRSSFVTMPAGRSAADRDHRRRPAASSRECLVEASLDAARAAAADP